MIKEVCKFICMLLMVAALVVTWYTVWGWASGEYPLRIGLVFTPTISLWR